MCAWEGSDQKLLDEHEYLDSLGLAIDLDIMGDLQIIGERDCMGTGYIAERFEVVHSKLLS